MPKTLFITGTDTEVGKTFVACLIARSLRHSDARVGVYKPVASGCDRQSGELVAGDAVELWNAAGQPRMLDDVCPQRFAAALAPDQAAALQGETVDQDQLIAGVKPWLDSDVLIIEGAGGLMSPLADGMLNSDLITKLESYLDQRLDVVVVSANRLGTIHQTLATCAAAQSLGIAVRGIYLNQVDRSPDQAAAGNLAQIARYSDVQHIESVQHQQQSDISTDWILSGN